MNYKSKPRSRNDIRKITDFIRDALDLSNSYEFPVVELLERLSELAGDPGFYMEIVEDYELNCYARIFPEEKKIVIRNSVYEGACNDNYRDRFTIAHEIGHYFLHPSSSISFARGQIKSYEDPEWQANTFAAELLVPHRLIQKMQPNEISKKCKVSRQVAEIQKNIVVFK